MLSLLTYLGTMWLSNGELPKPPGSAHEYSVPWQAFKTKDSYIVVAAREEVHWKNFCKSLGLTTVFDDERFKTNASRVAHRHALLAILEPFIALNISVGQARNQWNIESYVSLIKYIIQTGKEPLLFAIQKDYYLIDLIQQHIPSIQYYPIGRHILEVGEALTYAAITISPDTGFLHLASVANCPIIGLYCALSEDVKNEWAPFRVQNIRIFSETDKVSDISEQSVIDAFVKLDDMINHS